MGLARGRITRIEPPRKTSRGSVFVPVYVDEERYTTWMPEVLAGAREGDLVEIEFVEKSGHKNITGMRVLEKNATEVEGFERADNVSVDRLERIEYRLGEISNKLSTIIEMLSDLLEREGEKE